MSEVTKNHETIHWQQYIDCGILGFIILYYLFYAINLIRYRDLYDMSCMDLNHKDLKKLLFDWDGEPEVSKKLQR